MAQKKMTSHATGPRTKAGKAVSFLNAVTHGTLSSRLLLPHEDPNEYEALRDNLCLALQPVGALEQLLVDRIAGVVWRRLRMEGAEQALLTAAQLHPATDEELSNALELWREKLPDWMYETVKPDAWEAPIRELMGTKDEVVRKPLPDWMREQDKMPTAAQGALAEELCREWEATMNDDDAILESEDDARRQCPAHWQLLQAEAERMADGDPARALKRLYNSDDFIEGFWRYLHDQHEAHYWIAYCHRHRDKLDTAFAAIRAKRMLAAWDPEKAHRYTTMLDNQLFKLLRELREMRAWRLDHLEMMEDAHAVSSADVAHRAAQTVPASPKKSAPSRRSSPS